MTDEWVVVSRPKLWGQRQTRNGPLYEAMLAARSSGGAVRLPCPAKPRAFVSTVRSFFSTHHPDLVVHGSVDTAQGTLTVWVEEKGESK